MRKYSSLYSSHTKQKKSRLAKAIMFLSITLLVGSIYYYSQYNYLINTPVDANDIQNNVFIIKKGETLNSIADNLFRKNLISDIGAFKIYSRLSNLDKNIIAGKFILHKSMTIPEILTTLSSQEKSETVITIPEGYTVKEINDTLLKEGLIANNEFEMAVKQFNSYEKYPFLNEEAIKDLPYPLEGYLFPDTYFIDPLNFYSENLIQLMLNNTASKLKELDIIDSPNLQETIIMASIVEKEVMTEKDAPIVAGILLKRYKENWQIGADATLLYLKNDREIDYYDLQEDSPYNTRKKIGLPPGPISNPGLVSLRATVHPEDSPYYYYLTTLDTGEVIYAETNDQHNANKRKYL